MKGVFFEAVYKGSSEQMSELYSALQAIEERENAGEEIWCSGDYVQKVVHTNNIVNAIDDNTVVWTGVSIAGADVEATMIKHFGQNAKETVAVFHSNEVRGYSILGGIFNRHKLGVGGGFDDIVKIADERREHQRLWGTPEGIRELLAGKVES